MSTANSGAVFFLGTRAHYQVLSAPDQAYDQENGNSSTDTIYENNGNDAIIEIEDTREFDFGSGVKRRLRKNRKQDGSSELILNDNEEYQDYDPSDMNSIDDSGTPKLKSKSRARITVSHLLALLARRKRGTDWSHCGELACSYRDSCRCLECQSRYFECDESEDDYFESNSDDDSYSCEYEEPPPPPESVHQNDDDDDDEVFLAPQQDTVSNTDLLPPAGPEGRPSRALGLAAGAPALCDHLLSHPIACAIQ